MTQPVRVGVPVAPTRGAVALKLVPNNTGRWGEEVPDPDADCPCSYHGILRGVLVLGDDATSPPSQHGRDCLRVLMLESARATFRQDWREATVVAQRLVFVSMLLCREATAALVVSEGLSLP